MNCPKYTMEQLHIFDEIPSGVLVNIFEGDVLKFAYCNSYLANYLGYSHEEFVELLTNNCFAAIYEADREKAQSARGAVWEGKIVDSISRQNKKDGSYVWILAHIRQIEVDGKKGMLFFFSKIQELIGLQNELSEKNKKWTDILKSVPIGLMVFKIENGVTTTLVVNHNLVEFANNAGTQLDSKHRDWNEAEIAMIFNQDIYAFCENEDIPIAKKMVEESEKDQVSSCIFRLRGSIQLNKEVYIYANCASKVTGENSRTYYVTYQNVTEVEKSRIELVENQKKLYELSYYDSLTGVKNRNAYNEFSRFCRRIRMYNVGIAFCDINGLKQTNDSLGHYYGDQMITRFAELLKEYVNPDNIYRLSGDEFIVIWPNVERNEFQRVMGQLIDRVQAEDDLASIGYIWEVSVSNIQKRTTQAEQIMYVEKQNYYEINRAISSKHRPLFLDILLKDFEEGRYVMYLQPKTSIDNSKVIGAEALARKIGPDGRIISPYEFVPQLEQERLIPKLDFFMLEETCKMLQELHDKGKDDFSISVNVSRVTIVENSFVRNVDNILKKYSFERKNLEIELTESTKTMDTMRLEEYLLQLKQLGVKISLDDMGTDYSSLNLLVLEGIDWVKLDRSLISKINQDKSKILLKHIINMCQDLNLKVIAEGVEIDADRELLKNFGCDAYQGFLKSKPISVEDFRNKII